MDGSLGISSRLPVQGSCSSTARAVDELLIAQGLCQHFDKRVQGRWRAKGGWNPKRNLLQLAEGISSARAEHRAHLGLTPVSPFPLNSYISIWKNNFAWRNTVYGKWARFSWWFRCHRDYEVKAPVLKGCRLLTEITRNIMLWDLTFIHSVHQVLICTQYFVAGITVLIVARGYEQGISRQYRKGWPCIVLTQLSYNFSLDLTCTFCTLNKYRQCFSSPPPAFCW